MSILCAIFGHKTNEGVYGGAEYMKLGNIEAIDGIGRTHVNLIAECPRCKQKYKAGMMHLPNYQGPVVK